MRLSLRKAEGQRGEPPALKEIIMSELKERAIKAAARFLTHRGYEVIESQWKPEDGSPLGPVAREDGAVVFVDVYARHGIDRGMPDGGSEASRERREIAAAAWLSERGQIHAPRTVHTK